MKEEKKSLIFTCQNVNGEIIVDSWVVKMWMNNRVVNELKFLLGIKYKGRAY